MSMIKDTAELINKMVKQYEEDKVLKCYDCEEVMDLTERFCPKCARFNPVSLLI